MYIQVPITVNEFTSIMTQIQTDKTFPKTEIGMTGLYAHLAKAEAENNADYLIDPLMLNATWTEYCCIGEFKKNNFKVGSKTFESISEVRDFTAVVEIENSPIILVASMESYNEWLKENFPTPEADA